MMGRSEASAVGAIFRTIRAEAGQVKQTATITVVNATAGSYTATDQFGNTIYLQSTTPLIVGNVVEFSTLDHTITSLIESGAIVTVDV